MCTNSSAILMRMIINACTRMKKQMLSRLREPTFDSFHNNHYVRESEIDIFHHHDHDDEQKETLAISIHLSCITVIVILSFFLMHCSFILSQSVSMRAQSENALNDCGEAEAPQPHRRSWHHKLVMMMLGKSKRCSRHW